VPLPYLATQVMLGKTLAELDPWSMQRGGFTCVKEAVFPFNRFPGVDLILGPEMRSTGEVMGMGKSFEEAFLKSQIAAGQRLPRNGKVFLSVNDRDKPALPAVARTFAELGFSLLATAGTARLLQAEGLEVEQVFKVYEGRPNIVDLIKNKDIALVVNTASGKLTAHDSKEIRRGALIHGIPYCTTLASARASARAIRSAREGIRVESLQDYYAKH
jgi:carbamoyl-phosphate synthase large subunit